MARPAGGIGSGAVARWWTLELDLGFPVLEAGRLVEAGGRGTRVGGDDERLGPELADAEPAGLAGQCSRQPLAPCGRMSLDVLVTGQPGNGNEQTELCHKLAVEKRAEPRSVAGLRQPRAAAALRSVKLRSAATSALPWHATLN
jgi:hypothetical protein